jgi:hypothetical protein
MTSGGGIKKYIIDTCCFMSLDGIERQKDRYTSEQQKIIWNGIEGICSRITIIPQVKHELQKYYPEPLPSRIKSLPCMKMGYVGPIATLVQKILKSHPTLIRPYAHHTRDPADPWIVAVAQHYGYVVVTDVIFPRNSGHLEKGEACSPRRWSSWVDPDERLLRNSNARP